MTVRTPRRRTRRWGLRAAVAVLALALVWLLTCWAVLQHPRVDDPAPSDALFVLGPHDPARMAEALRLMEEGVAPVLVVATPDPESGYWYSAEDRRFMEEKDFCAQDLGYEVVCFAPDPSTTQGEAMELRELSARRGWEHVSALTFRQHVPRARMLLERCFDGELGMVPFDYGYGAAELLRQFLYQSGGFVKAWLTPGCDQQLPGRPKSLA